MQYFCIADNLWSQYDKRLITYVYPLLLEIRFAADENVHTNTPGGFKGDQDVRYHEGTCQGGSDSGACDLDIITDPGNSDDNRQDDN